MGLQVAKLLLNISRQSGQHQHTLLRLAIVGLEGLAQATSKHQQSTEEEFAAKYAFLQSTADRAKFLDFATTVMLYQPAALLPRVMHTASQNPAEASRSLKTHMLHCFVSKWHLVSQQKQHSCLWHMPAECTPVLHSIGTTPDDPSKCLHAKPADTLSQPLLIGSDDAGSWSADTVQHYGRATGKRSKRWLFVTGIQWQCCRAPTHPTRSGQAGCVSG